MKYAMIGDMHLGVRNGNRHFLNFQLGWFRKTCKAIKEAGIKIIVQPGDMYDNRKMLDVLVGQVSKREIAKVLEEFDLTMVISVGNHNIFHRDSNEVTNLWHLEDNHRIKIVYDTLVLNEELMVVGWINKENHDRVMAEIQSTPAPYCIGHFEFDGFPMYKGLMATHGMSYSNFKKFKRVMSGHYHTVSDVYIGSPYHLTWADYPDGQERGWFIFDSEANTLEIQRNSKEDTLFHIMEYDPSKAVDEIDFTPLIGKINRVVVKDQGDTRRYNRFLAALKELDVIECKIVDQTIVTQATKEGKEAIDVDVSKLMTNMRSSLGEYASSLASTVEGADVSRTQNMMINLYERAQG